MSGRGNRRGVSVVKKGGRGRGGGSTVRKSRTNVKSQTTLSGLFAQLEKQTSKVGERRSVRQVNAQKQQKNRRQAILDAKRKGGNVAQAAKAATSKAKGRGRGAAGRGRGRGRGGRGAAGKKTGVTVAKSKNAKKAGGRGRGSGKAKGGAKGKGKGDKKEAEIDPENMMDTYWHEGGKGPDPKVLEIERTMDSYWDSKPDSAAATAVVESAVAEDGDTEM